MPLKQNDRSVQKTIFFFSNVYEFQWKLVHFYKVWRSCPASMDFCVKGSYCCVPSVGWNRYRAAGLQWLTSALLIIAVLHCCPHYHCFLLCMSPVFAWSLHVFSYLGFHLQLLFCFFCISLWLHAFRDLLPGISGLLESWGLLPVTDWALTESLLAWNLHFSWGRGWRVWPSKELTDVIIGNV